MNDNDNNDNNVLGLITIIVGFIVFISTVIWCFSTYGFILGLVVSIVAAPIISAIITFAVSTILGLLFISISKYS